MINGIARRDSSKMHTAVPRLTVKMRVECIAIFPGYCLKSNYVATEAKAKTRAVIEMQRSGAKTKAEIQAHCDTTTLEEHEMLRLGAFLARLRKNQKGATMIEYSILIGIITVAAITLIGTMGQYVVDQWTALVAATS